MTSYVRNWFLGGTSSPPSNGPLAIPTLLETSPPPSGDDDDNDNDDNDDDRPSMFPSLSSAQRITSPSPGVPRILTDSDLMPPPPVPRLASRQPGVSLSVSNSSSLSVPTTTKRPDNPSKKRGKVALAPGHSPLDWANLKTSGEDLRGGIEGLMRIPLSVLKTHNKRDDAWSAFHGKVYNITPYLSFHPGGDKELMRVAGRDGTKLFTSTHSWVNIEYMLDACLVGFLVPEPST